MVEDNVNIEVVPQIKLLGTLITSYFKWDINTQHLVQKAAVRLTMGSDYIGYSHALKSLDIDPLKKRREKLC